MTSVEADAGWPVHHRRGTVADLHALDLPGPEPVARGVWVLEATAPAVVLGSAQRSTANTSDVVRSSGGGAVLVDPECCVWVDVVIARHDPLWHDDVGRSSLWLGRCWQAALAAHGIVGEVHEGPADRHDLARAACFAGVGPGEVLSGGRKVVGISQRRTRSGVRYQCIVYTSPPPAAPVVTALGGGAPPGLGAALDVATGSAGIAAPVLVDALHRAMMATSSTLGAS